MNRTNRALNRILLFVVGVLYFALGAALVTVILWPAAAELWTGVTMAGRSWIESSIAATMIGTSQISWTTIAALVLIVFLVAVLIVALTRIGGRRSHIMHSNGAQNSLGRIRVHDAFVSDVMKHSLGRRDGILSSSVTVDDIGKTSVLHVSVTPRQNTSPRDVVKDVDQLVASLATLTGKNLPTFISIHSGLRANLARKRRLA